jgi:NUAK family SNF1-like kinase
MICHRDLKLENILMTTDNTIKIIDFGLSNVFSFDYLLKTKCGSPKYASPQLLFDAHYNGPAVDVWALGVNLFAMNCGFLPFD